MIDNFKRATCARESITIIWSPQVYLVSMVGRGVIKVSVVGRGTKYTLGDQIIVIDSRAHVARLKFGTNKAAKKKKIL